MSFLGRKSFPSQHATLAAFAAVYISVSNQLCSLSFIRIKTKVRKSVAVYCKVMCCMDVSFAGWM